MERLYLEYAPDTSALQYLINLRNNLRTTKTTQLVPEQEMHLTVLHFGIVDTVYRELTRQYPNLTRETFDSAVHGFAVKAHALLDGQISAQATSVQFYGQHGQIAVLELEVTEKLRSAQKQCQDFLIECFEACGVENAERYLQSDHNFKHAFSFTPHITLARNVLTQEPYVTKQEKLHLNLVPFNYDMKHGRYT